MRANVTVDETAAPRWPLLAIAVAFLLSLSIVGLGGGFPLNDDWSYTLTTQRLLKLHDWRPSGFTSMPLITNALWGALFCGGAAPCSTLNLRLSSVAACLLLLVASFLLLRTRFRSQPSLWAALVVIGFNPLVYTLSLGFMTDLLFAALVTLGAVFYVRALREDQPRLWMVATVFAVLATMSRQLALCLPAAWLIVRLLPPGRMQPSRLIEALAPLALCGISLVAFGAWMHATGRTPALYDVQSHAIVETLKSPVHSAIRVVQVLSTMVMYLGLFSAPLLIFSTPRALGADLPPWVRHLPLALASVTVLMVLAVSVKQKHVMPFGGDIVIPQGIGPLTLRDTFVLGAHDVPPLPAAFWLLASLAAAYGAFELVRRVAIFLVGLGVDAWRGRRLEVGEPDLLFATLAILIYIGPLMLSGAYDRYSVAILPLTLFFVIGASAGQTFGAVRYAVVGVILAGLAVFSVLGAHDYMSWNRARWAAIHDLETRRGATSKTIDGGFEYDGANNYDPSYQEQPGKSFWWVVGDDYVVSFAPIEGRPVVGKYEYSTLLPPGRRFIYVLAR